MDVREKLVELLRVHPCSNVDCEKCDEFQDGCWLGKLADKIICNGVTVQEWISVKDRLPKSMDWVLCICADGKFHILRYDYISEDWDIYNKNNCCYGEWFVTHWMPLPQPPKGE